MLFGTFEIIRRKLSISFFDNWFVKFLVLFQPTSSIPDVNVQSEGNSFGPLESTLIATLTPVFHPWPDVRVPSTRKVCQSPSWSPVVVFGPMDCCRRSLPACHPTRGKGVKQLKRGGGGNASCGAGTNPTHREQGSPRHKARVQLPFY